MIAKEWYEMKWLSPGRVRVEPTVNKQKNDLFSSSRHPYFWRKNFQNKTRQRQWHPIKWCGSPIRSPDSFNIDPIWYLYAHIGLYIIGIVFLLMCVCGIVLQRSVYIRCFFLSIAAWYRLHNYISLNIKNIDFLKKRETENWWIT